MRIAGTRVVSGAPYAQGPMGISGESAPPTSPSASAAPWVDGSEGLLAALDIDDARRDSSRLGTAVALAGDTVAAGAPGFDADAGRVYLFRSSAPEFTEPPTATPASVTLLQPVAFAGAAEDPDGDDVGLLWSFGDGATSTIAAPTHRYRTPGAFDATLTANDGLAEATATAHVDVAPATATMAALTLAERYREYLAPVGGGGPDEERGGGGGGGGRELAADGRFKVKGTMAPSPEHLAALGPASRFRFGLGDNLVDVALADDPEFAPGATRAQITVIDEGFEDEGSRRAPTSRSRSTGATARSRSSSPSSRASASELHGIRARGRSRGNSVGASHRRARGRGGVRRRGGNLRPAVQGEGRDRRPRGRGALGLPFQGAREGPRRPRAVSRPTRRALRGRAWRPGSFGLVFHGNRP